MFWNAREIADRDRGSPKARSRMFGAFTLWVATVLMLGAVFAAGAEDNPGSYFKVGVVVGSGVGGLVASAYAAIGGSVWDWLAVLFDIFSCLLE